jgi:hypothetical protein
MSDVWKNDIFPGLPDPAGRRVETPVRVTPDDPNPIRFDVPVTSEDVAAGVTDCAKKQFAAEKGSFERGEGTLAVCIFGSLGLTACIAHTLIVSRFSGARLWGMGLGVGYCVGCWIGWWQWRPIVRMLRRWKALRDSGLTIAQTDEIIQPELDRAAAGALGLPVRQESPAHD